MPIDKNKPFDPEYYDEDGYGGSVEGIYNWDEWN